MALYCGIDQALGHTGVAILSRDGDVEELTVVKTGSLVGTPRLASIRDQTRTILSKYNINQAAIEGYAYDATGRTFDLGEVGGVIRLLLHDLGIPFVVVSPAALKKFVTGNAQASKDQVRAGTLEKWGIEIESDDACDAHGLARVARLYAGGSSTSRAELEVVQQLKSPKTAITKSARSKIKITV